MPSQAAPHELARYSTVIGGEPLRLLLATMLATGLGSGGLLFLPYIIGSTMDGLGLTATQAGTLGACEAVVSGVMTLLLSSAMSRLSRRNCCLGGAAIVTLGNLLSAFAPDYFALSLLRAFTGVGDGLVIAGSKAVVAQTRNPARFYAAIIICVGVVHSTALLKLLSWVVHAWTYRGGFLLLALIAALSIPAFTALPGRPVIADAGPGVTRTEPPASVGMQVLAVLAMVVSAFGAGSIWGFAERLGMQLSLSAELVSTLIAVATIAGTAVAAWIAIVGTRYGTLRPLLAGVLMQAAGALLVVFAADAPGFGAGIVLYMVGWYLHVPYLVGILGQIDPGGRLIVLGYGMFLLAAASSPALAGLIIDATGFGSLGIASAISSLLVLPAARVILLRLSAPSQQAGSVCA
jgi:DHA1 family inner membrane transport protein